MAHKVREAYKKLCVLWDFAKHPLRAVVMTRYSQTLELFLIFFKNNSIPTAH